MFVICLELKQQSNNINININKTQKQKLITFHINNIKNAVGIMMIIVWNMYEQKCQPQTPSKDNHTLLLSHTKAKLNFIFIDFNYFQGHN